MKEKKPCKKRSASCSLSFSRSFRTSEKIGSLQTITTPARTTGRTPASSAPPPQTRKQR
jgi:hypothetical protein